MKFGFTLLEWIEAIPQKSIQDIYELAVDGIVSWEFYIHICELAKICVGV